MGGRPPALGPRGLRPPFPREGARGHRLPRFRLGAHPQGARPRRGDAQAPARRVPGRVLREGRGVDGLRPLLQALPRARREEKRREPRRAQGGKGHGGRLGRADDGGRRPGDGRGLQGLPVRGLPALQPHVVGRADARHEAGYMASLPRARIRLLRRRGSLHRAGQPQDGRQAPSPRGRGRHQRRVPGDGSPLRGGGDARAREGAARQAQRGERGVAGGRRGDSGAARNGLRGLRRAQGGRQGEGRRAQLPPPLQTGGRAEAGLRGAGTPAPEAAAGRPLRGLRVGVRAQGPAQLPRVVQAQLLLGDPSRRRQGGRPARH